MTLAIIWEQAPSPHVIIAKVGAVKVGIVQHESAVAHANASGKNTYYMIHLPDVDSDEGWVSSEKSARKIIEREVTRWFQKTGLIL